jgi:glycosyltransferase involved in cell wall biosynthesis
VSATGRVVVYEPDGVNPYGREIALLLAASGLDVCVVLAQDAGWTPPAVGVRRTLPRNGPAPHRTLQAFALARSLGWCLAMALLRPRTTWLVVWTRSVADELLFALLARLGRRVVLVVHNPGSRQPPGRLRASSTRVLRGAATVGVAHSDELRTELQPQRPGKDVAVCPHPPYSGWWQDHAPAVDRSPSDVLVLGQLQPHKGLEQLPAILDLLPAHIRARLTLTLCGKGSLDAGLATELAARVRVVDRTSRGFVSDADLALELGRAAVLLAPYRGATQSGTVALALTAGLRVVAFEDGAVADLVDDSGLVPPGDAARFARRVVDSLEEGRAGGPRLPLSTWREQARSAWADAVVS